MLPTSESQHFTNLNLTMVVKDIEKTSQYLSSIFGIGPWETMDYSPVQDELIVGDPFKLRFAFTTLGPIAIQLTQPIEGNSPWKAFLDKTGEGMYNIYFEVPDWEKKVRDNQKKGNKILASGKIDGKRWCLFESKLANFKIEIGEI